MKSFKVDVDESNTQKGARLAAPLEHQGEQITNRGALKTLLPGEAKWTLELGTSEALTGILQTTCSAGQNIDSWVLAQT